jgi:O-antigen ligase
MEKIVLTLKNALLNENLQVFGFGLISILMIFGGMETGKSVFIIAPALFLVSFVIYFKPQLILFLFLISFYAGIQLYGHNMLMVDFSDVAAMFFFLAVFSKLFQKKNFSFDFSGTKNISGILIIFLMISVFSVILNIQTKKPIDILTSIWYIFNLIELILVLMIFSQSYFKNNREMNINIVLIFSVFEMILAFYQYSGIGSSSAAADSLREVKGTFSNHHAMLGNMMVLTFAFCFYRSMISKNLILKILYISGMLLSVYMVIISGSRSTLFGVFSTIAVFIILNIKFTKKFIIYCSIILTVTGYLFLFSPVHDIVLNTFKNNQTNQLDLSSLGRLLVWKGAVQNFIEAPILNKLFGVGFGNFYTMKYSFRLLEGNNYASGGHNNYLHVLTETGIIGLMVFLILFGFILVRLWKKSKEDKFCLAYFYATLILLFSGFTQETFWFQYAFYRFWIIYILFLGFCFCNEKQKGLPEAV